MDLRVIISEITELQKAHKSGFEGFEKYFTRRLPMSSGDGLGADDILDILAQIKIALYTRIERYSFIINELENERFPVNEKIKMKQKGSLIKLLLESFNEEYFGTKGKLRAHFPGLDFFDIERQIHDFKGFILQVIEEIDFKISGITNESYSKDALYYYFSFSSSGEIQLNPKLGYDRDKYEFFLNADRTKIYSIHGYPHRVNLMNSLLSRPGEFISKEEMASILGLKSSYPHGETEIGKLDQIKDKLMETLRGEFNLTNNDEKFIEVKKGYRISPLG